MANKKKKHRQDAPQETPQEEWDVVMYSKKSGEKPVEEFLKNDLPDLAAEMGRKIDALQKRGNLLRYPDSAPLVRGLLELRAKRGNNISRILYFFTKGRKAVLLTAFRKKEQKTPLAVVRLAERYRKDYLDRQDQGQKGTKK
ncbi:type II toxin-antitoxin system RelE/ParE family toxin [Mitsuokella jalaludinii]|uniref:type II toxin-antitoxin system RelE/ParE family toxin n=1 Tax=Mitsuokella jalaludinii TaxID=187979 RepID=UPI003F886B3C